MLEGKDFIILSHDEMALIYRALEVNFNKATYRMLQDQGILQIVDKMRRILYPVSDD